MKILKQADVYFQFFLMLFVIVSLFQTEPFLQSYEHYFLVGGWQFVSMLFHEFAGRFTAKGGRRRTYQNAVYIIVAFMVAGFIVPFFLYIFFILVFVAPFMAIYYLFICYDETYHHMQRPLAQLK